MMNRRAAAYLLAFLLATCIGALFSTPVSSIAYTKSIAAGKHFQPQAYSGWFTTATAFTFSAPTSRLGSVRVFPSFHMTPGSTFPTIGFGTKGGNMTVTAVDDKSVSMNLVVPVLGTVTGYLYAPGYYEPDVTGALTQHWYDGNKTLVFTRATTGTVTVSWGSPETDTVMWERVFPDTFMVLGLLAIVVPAAAVIAILVGGGRDPMQIIGLVSFMVLVSLAALVIANAVIAF